MIGAARVCSKSVHHLNNAGVFEFNPYEGKTYRELLNGALDPIDGVDIDTAKVISNPGMTTLYDAKKDLGKAFVGYNGVKYSGVNGFFNAQYLPYHRGYTEYWHEGTIDVMAQLAASGRSEGRGRLLLFLQTQRSLARCEFVLRQTRDYTLFQSPRTARQTQQRDCAKQSRADCTKRKRYIAPYMQSASSRRTLYRHALYPRRRNELTGHCKTHRQ